MACNLKTVFGVGKVTFVANMNDLVQKLPKKVENITHFPNLKHHQQLTPENAGLKPPYTGTMMCPLLRK